MTEAQGAQLLAAVADLGNQTQAIGRLIAMCQVTLMAVAVILTVVIFFQIWRVGR